LAGSPALSYDRNTVIDWLLIVVPGVIWGASFLFIAEGLTAVAPDGVTFIRIVIGFLTLSLVPGARKPILRSDWTRVAALGVLWFAFPMSMFPYAEQWISSALTGMLNGTVPLFATVVAALLQRRWPVPMVVAGVAAGLFGGVLMAWPGIGAGGNSAAGILMVIAACISYGFAVNLARPLQQRNGALPVIWRALLVGAILTAPLGLPRALDGHFTLRPVLSLLALGALGTCVATVMTTIASGRLGATSASVSAYFIPVVALILGLVVRNEHVATISIVGGAVSLAAAWVVRVASMKAAAAAAVPSGATVVPAK
jgi:drug/metabolite transporter (DMT)-like permease